MRQKIGLGQIRNSAAHYFDRVAAGESFDVVRRGRMVAQIVPIGAVAHDDDDVGEGERGTEGADDRRRSEGSAIADTANGVVR
jgi:antitoxin (DNA-binding transcriptional repressor) of toxin-antitoxin stability system